MAQTNKNFSESPHKRHSKRRRTLSSTRESKYRALPAYFQKEHEDDVFNALDAIERDVMMGNPIRWNMLLPAIRGMNVNTETAPDCLNFAKALLGLFERYHCKDIRVISDIFAVLLFITECHHEPQEADFDRIFIYPCGQENKSMDSVWEAVTSANLGLLRLQLKFGAEMIMPSNTDLISQINTLLSDWVIEFGDDVTGDGSSRDHEILVESGILNDFGLTKECVQEMGTNISRNFNPQSLNRFRLISRMLQVVYATKLCHPDCIEHFTECYELLFDSIPEAFVTSVEVKAVLEKCLPVSSARLISRITQDFKNMLPELAEVPQPRSLKHLCRIEVRKSLRQNLNLPSGVSLLPLPKILKQYIMLNDKGDYSVIMEISRVLNHPRDMHSNQELHITIPEKDDCVTSFFKNL